MKVQRISLLFLLAASLAPGAQADEGPRPPATAVALQCLVGTWGGTGTYTSGTQTAPLTVDYTCRSVGGVAVACQGEIRGIPGVPAYVFSDLYGYDAETDMVHWYVVTNAGETHDHAGRIANDHFTGRYVGRSAGRRLVEDVAIAFEGEDRFDVRSTSTIGGKTSETIAMSAHRL